MSSGAVGLVGEVDGVGSDVVAGVVAAVAQTGFIMFHTTIISAQIIQYFILHSFVRKVAK